MTGPSTDTILIRHFTWATTEFTRLLVLPPAGVAPSHFLDFLDRCSLSSCRNFGFDCYFSCILRKQNQRNSLVTFAWGSTELLHTLFILMFTSPLAVYIPGSCRLGLHSSSSDKNISVQPESKYVAKHYKIHLMSRMVF